MFGKSASAAEAAAFGLTPEEAAGAPVEIWSDNLPSVEVFSAMATQWRTGPGGVIGLDYGVLPEIWRRLKVPGKDRDDVFADLRIMEDAALKAIR